MAGGGGNSGSIAGGSDKQKDVRRRANRPRPTTTKDSVVVCKPTTSKSTQVLDQIPDSIPPLAYPPTDIEEITPTEEDFTAEEKDTVTALKMLQQSGTVLLPQPQQPKKEQNSRQSLANAGVMFPLRLRFRRRHRTRVVDWPRKRSNARTKKFVAKLQSQGTLLRS